MQEVETKEKLPNVEPAQNPEQQEEFQRMFEKPNSSWEELKRFANS